MAAELQRLEHQGAAPATGLASGMGSGDTSFTVLSGTGYPTGAGGKLFVIAIDPNTPQEEKILCSARSGATFTVNNTLLGGRGFDGTTAASHSTGLTNVEHVASAIEIDDANRHLYTTTDDDHGQYLLTTGGRTITGLTGATAGARIVGGTTGGAPITGSFSTRDVVADPNGLLVCQSGGSPGTWVRVGGGHYVARYYANTSITLPGIGSNIGVIKFDTQDYDPASIYSSSTGFFTVPVAGVWTFSGTVTINTDATHSASGDGFTIGWINTTSNSGSWTAIGPIGNYPLSTSQSLILQATADLNLSANATIAMGGIFPAVLGLSGSIGSGNSYVSAKFIGTAI